MTDEAKIFKKFDELVKDLKIDKVSELYLLITKPTLTINYTLLSNLVYEVAMSITKDTKSLDSADNNKYSEKLNLLKWVLIDMYASRSIISYYYVPNKLYKYRKQDSQIHWQVNDGNFLAFHKILLVFALLEFCLIKEITHIFVIDKTKTSS